MRLIKKQGQGGFSLQRASLHPPQTPSLATRAWANLGAKDKLLQCLLDEQFYLCCYSELRSDELGLGYHIEHVENKGQNPLRTFDYSNLAASALESNTLGVFKNNGYEVFAGHAIGKAGRRNPVDMQQLISPHQVGCHRFFAYLSDGRVVAAIGLKNSEEKRVKYTIEVLNLNSSFLITLRKKWWDELDELFDEHVDKGWSLSHLAEIDLIPRLGKLSRFFSLTRQFFGDVSEKTLRNKAPALL